MSSSSSSSRSSTPKLASKLGSKSVTAKPGGKTVTGSASATKTRTAGTPSSKKTGFSSGTATPTTKKGTGKQRVARHVDQRVQARNSALNAFGGVKVDVFVRVRPKLDIESGQNTCVAVDDEESVIEILDPSNGHPSHFSYDKVYGPESSQATVYDDCVAPIVEQVSRGMNCCIFAYGQTGAGKTFTMRGDLSEDSERLGIIQRSLSHLLIRMKEHEYSDVHVKCSFLEIYNEELEDLFDETKPTSKKRSVKNNNLMLIDEDGRGCICKGLKEVDVESVPQVMKLLNTAEAKARYSETKMNKLSNRAHRIFTLIVGFKRYDKHVQSTLTFVDLAGSEDISKSGATGLTAREASHINKSLLTLGRVINALACNERHIPYRDSKLTRLLSEALGGVCKTSFIACISPSSGSFTESSITLRYAERAMEALNISQLPRWKQDEIMIDGLTRRVQQLVDDLESMRKMHVEEMQGLKSERDALLTENMQHKRELGRAYRKIERLAARKSELKSGVNLLVSQKDHLLEEKSQLQQELLVTRMDRDGLINDRENMTIVLKAVRAMRNRLLDAHSKTEKALTNDALALKKTIEVAIADIDELHAEIARKKSLSTHNETKADAYLTRLSAHLRDIIQEVQDFKSVQDSHHSDIHLVLSELRGTRQRETSTITNDVNRLNANITSTFKDLIQQAEELESARKSRIAKGRDDASSHAENLHVALERAQTSVVSRLNELRKHSNELNSSVESWSERAAEHLSELLSSSKNFSMEMNGKLQALEDHMKNETQSQIRQLEEHHDALATYLKEEKEALSSKAEKTIEDITTYVARMVRDHTTQAQRRTENAINNFKDRTSTIVGDIREFASSQTSQLHVAHDAINKHEKGTDTNIVAAKATSSRQLAIAQNILSEVRQSAQQTETDTVEHVSELRQTVSLQKENKLKFFSEDEAAAQQARSASERIFRKGIKEIQADSEGLRTTLDNQLQSFSSTTESMGEKLTSTHSNVRTFTDVTQEQLYDTEADGVNYVMQEIERDTKDSPVHKTYSYPQDYAKTPEYASLLSDNKDGWTREVGIVEGNVKPGRGTDYPGLKGAADKSGLLTSTLPKPLAPPEQHRLDRAQYDSDMGEYSDPEGFVDPMDRNSSEDEDDTQPDRVDDNQPVDEQLQVEANIDHAEEDGADVML